MKKKQILTIAAFSLLLTFGVSGTAFAAGTWKNGTSGERYYIDENGVQLENQWFSVTSTPKEPHVKPSTAWYYAGEDGSIYRNGWFTIGGHEYYFYSGGNAVRDGVVTIDGNKYYITAETGKQSGGWFSIERLNAKNEPYLTWYYANEDGSLLYDGWKEIGGKLYYFYAGANSPRKAWLNLEGKRYYVGEDGSMEKSGWFAITGVNSAGQEYSNWYFAAGDGDIVRDGWREMDGHSYYFDKNGLNYRKRWLVGEQKERYYFDENGWLQTGWFDITNVNANTGAVSVTTYYAKANGQVLVDGYHEVDGKTYKFGTGGNLIKKSWMVDAGKGRKYLGDDGAMKAGEWFSISGVDSNNSEYTYWYYADETGRVLRDGWHTIDGKQYYLDGSGRRLTGWVDGNKFYCGEDGARLYGWQYLELLDSWKDDDGTVLDNYTGNYGKHAWFYFTPETGRVKYSTSGTFQEFEVDGATYCVDERGIIQLGWIKQRGGSPVITGYKYYAEKDTDQYKMGQRVDKGWIKTVGPDEDSTGNEEWFYIQDSGYPVCASPGTRKIETIDGKRYLFDSYGNAQSGLQEVNGRVYCFGKGEGDFAALTGTVRINDGSNADASQTSEYCFENTGAGVNGVRGGKYYCQGKLQKADSQSKYEAFDLPGVGIRLLNSSGKIVKNKTVKDGNDDEWKTAANGEIVQFGNSHVAEVVEPDAETE